MSPSSVEAHMNVHARSFTRHIYTDLKVKGRRVGERKGLRRSEQEIREEGDNGELAGWFCWSRRLLPSPRTRVHSLEPIQ